ncbi:MAG: ATP-binding protein [Rudaea sp.]|uniref:two-component system sensor histidine kinase NtrB n=1 Tax=Rudaea sp. TaxID=2136325 RepID=UPI0039E43586
MKALSLLPSTNGRPLEIAEQLETGVALLDRDEILVYANPAFCELLAVSPSRSRSLPFAALGEGARVLTPLIERVRTEASTLHRRNQRIETRAQRSLHADVTIGPAAGGMVLIEVHQLAAEPDAATPTNLSESLRGLAHEVKNPLAGVRGAAQLLARRVTDPELARLADLIMTEADRLATLTNRLLEPGGKPRLAVLNLHEVAERARALIAAEAEPDLHLDRDYDPSLPLLRGHGDRLLQLVLNLMRNALQAGAARIGLRTRVEHNALIGEKLSRLGARLDVIDDGRGVPEEMRDTLFLPFVSGRSKGTGLGLALAQEIAAEHGGTLNYRSRPGQTVFTLLLPIASSNRFDEHG